MALSFTRAASAQSSVTIPGITITSGPSCATPSDTSSDVICAVIGSDKAMYSVRISQNGQQTVQNLGGIYQGNPSCANSNDGLLQLSPSGQYQPSAQVICAGVGQDGNLYALRFNPATGVSAYFEGIAPIGVRTPVSNPSCASPNDATGQIICAVVGQDQRLYAVRLDPKTGYGQNAGYQDLGEYVLPNTSPSCADSNDGTGQIICAVVGGDHALYAIRLNPSAQGGYVGVPGSYLLSNPSCASPNDGTGQIVCTTVGGGANGAHALYGTQLDPGTGYESGLQSLTGNVFGSPSCANGAGHVICGAVGGYTGSQNMYAIFFSPTAPSATAPFSSGFEAVGQLSQNSAISCADTGSHNSVICAGQGSSNALNFVTLPWMAFTSAGVGNPPNRLPPSGLYSLDPTAFEEDGTTRIWSCGGGYYFGKAQIGDGIYYYEAPPESNVFSSPAFAIAWSPNYTAPMASVACRPTVIRHPTDRTYRMYYECSIGPGGVTSQHNPNGPGNVPVYQSSVCTAMSYDAKNWYVWAAPVGSSQATWVSSSELATPTNPPTIASPIMASPLQPPGTSPNVAYGIGHPSAVVMGSEIWIYFYYQTEPGAAPIVYVNNTFDGLTFPNPPVPTNLNGPPSEIYAVDSYRGSFMIAVSSANNVGNYYSVSRDGLHFGPLAGAHLLPAATTASALKSNPAFVSDVQAHLLLSSQTTVATLISSETDPYDYFAPFPDGTVLRDGLFPITGTFWW